MVKGVLATVNAQLAHCESLVDELQSVLNSLKQGSQCKRLQNAEYALHLSRDLQAKEGAALVAALAEIKSITSLQALAKSITSSASVTQSIQDNNWQLLESIWSADDAEGKAIKRQVCDALAADELVAPLAPVLRQAQADATGIITRRVQPVSNPEPDPVIAPQPTGYRVVKQAKKSGLTSSQAKNLFAEIEQELAAGYVLDVSYTIIETDGSS